MIALAASIRLSHGHLDNHYEINIKPRWNLETLSAI